MSAGAHPAVARLGEAGERRRVPDLLAVAVAFALAAASFLHFGVTARGFISAIFVILLGPAVYSITESLH